MFTFVAFSFLFLSVIFILHFCLPNQFLVLPEVLVGVGWEGVAGRLEGSGGDMS